MRGISATIVAIAFMATACGVGIGTDDDYDATVPTASPPVVSRVDPNAGAAGDEITLFGFGFCIAYPENIVVVGGAATEATGYRLLTNPTSTEIEARTFTVPDDAIVGEGPISMPVYGDASNTDVSFTVVP